MLSAVYQKTSKNAVSPGEPVKLMIQIDFCTKQRVERIAYCMKKVTVQVPVCFTICEPWCFTYLKKGTLYILDVAWEGSGHLPRKWKVWFHIVSPRGQLKDMLQIHLIELYLISSAFRRHILVYIVFQPFFCRSRYNNKILPLEDNIFKWLGVTLICSECPYCFKTLSLLYFI